MTTLADYWRILRRRGARRLYDELVENWLFDLARGTDTQTIAARGVVSYTPSYTKIVSSALDLLEERLKGAGYTFYDLGCGKGKALLIAADSGLFDRLVGIELDSELAQIARDNVHKLGLQTRVDIRTLDAGEHTQYDGNLVLYLYNPFDNTVVQRVLEKLERSEARHVFLIYFDPRHESLLAGWQSLFRADWPGDANRCLAIFERTLGEPSKSAAPG